MTIRFAGVSVTDGPGRGRITMAAGLVVILWTASRASAPPSEAPILFTDVATTAGIDFVQTVGDDTMTNIVEATGVGCGLLDYDGDGWTDIYLVNGCWLPGLSDPKLDLAKRDRLAAATDRLYRNRGDGTFEDVTVKAGLARGEYGLGVVVADYDGDGDPDIYVTNYGPNSLYRNNGDGTFTNVARAAGVDDRHFSVGAVFFDYDQDGRLDLYVGNYLTYVPDPKQQHTTGGMRSPLAYQGQQDRMFRGNPDGTFTDVTRQAGIEIGPAGRAMGVGAMDYDDDGLVDIFVSNDAMENFLLHNNGDGRFTNQALMAGVAFAEAGDAAAAMAVEVADYDGDGLMDIFVPDMTLCCLYRNMGGGIFEDVARRSGIATAMPPHHSWGAVFADFDLDGDLDLYVSKGSAWRPEGQPDGLFVNDGQGHFEEVSKLAGAWAEKKFISRGVAGADFDNDGDIDLLVANLNDRPVLLRNDTPRRGRHWLQVTLVGSGANRDAIGAVVKVKLGDRLIVRHRASGGSYLSQHDRRIHFGLGMHRRADLLEVVWPDGSCQKIRDVRADQVLTIRQRPGRQGKESKAEAGGGSSLLP